MSWFMTTVSTLKDKLPKPVEYLKAVIVGDNNVRVAAFLAVISGIALCVGYVTLLFALVLGKELLTAFITVNAALVSLATFSKVDTNNTTTVKAGDTDITKDKKDIKG